MKMREEGAMRGSSTTSRDAFYLGGDACAVGMLHVLAVAGAENKLQTQMHFDVSQCQQTAPNLYKCPGVDKSICGAFYAGQQVDCVALDKDGNVIVMKQ